MVVKSIEVIIPRLRCEPKRVRRWRSLVIRVMVSQAQLTVLLRIKRDLALVSTATNSST